MRGRSPASPRRSLSVVCPLSSSFYLPSIPSSIRARAFSFTESTADHHPSHPHLLHPLLQLLSRRYLFGASVTLCPPLRSSSSFSSMNEWISPMNEWMRAIHSWVRGSRVVSAKARNQDRGRRGADDEEKGSDKRAAWGGGQDAPRSRRARQGTCSSHSRRRTLRPAGPAAAMAAAASAGG
jgi:hypothetical protein